MTRRVAEILVALCLFPAPGGAVQAEAAGPAPSVDPQTHVLIVVGLGGEERFRRSFLDWGRTMHDAALAAGVPPANLHFLAEDPDSDPERIQGRSTAEEVEEAFRELAAAVGAEDRVLVLLIGHGSGTREESRVSLPGPSLTAKDYARLVDALPGRSVAVVNAASASGDFIPVLAGEGRVIITATRSSGQRNATVFGEHFVQAFFGAAADLDRDGRVSLLEAFEYARQETERHYRDRGLIPSEHALIAEGADARGTALPMEEEGAGILARGFVLQSSASTTATAAPSSTARLAELHAERERLEARMTQLVSRRSSMDAEAHRLEMEALLVEIARVGRAIREIEGGGP